MTILFSGDVLVIAMVSVIVFRVKGIFMMGFLNHEGDRIQGFFNIEGREFSVYTEKRWKVVKELKLGLPMVQWVAKTQEQCLKEGRMDFYTTTREGNRSFIA